MVKSRKQKTKETKDKRLYRKWFGKDSYKQMKITWKKMWEELVDYCEREGK